MLHRSFSENYFVNLLGKWQTISTGNARSFPNGGLIYYISPPHGMKEATSDPFHTIIYVMFILFICGIFSKYWIEVSG